MARGNQKSSSSVKELPEVKGSEFKHETPLGEAPPFKTPEDAIRWMMKNSWTDITDPDADNGVFGKNSYWFIAAIRSYIQASHNTTERYKERREAVVALFERMPKSFQEAFAVPNSELSKVIRFADKKSSNLDEDGAACGFTTDPYYAKSFNEGEKGQRPVFVASDMESFRGSIDFEKLGKAFRKVLPEAMKTNIDFAQEVETLANLSLEKEKFFYGIKWKPEVDTPKWRKERIEEGKLISEDPKYFKPQK